LSITRTGAWKLDLHLQKPLYVSVVITASVVTAVYISELATGAEKKLGEEEWCRLKWRSEELAVVLFRARDAKLSVE
jgi:hypothetical protein